ncbi:MAG TPA: fibronectin type III domain-containing protein [Arthrobacter sp.]
MTRNPGLRPRSRALLISLSAAALLLSTTAPSMGAVEATRATAAAYLSPPAGLTAAASDIDRADLTWKPVPGAAEYRLAYSLSPDMANATWRDSPVPARTIYGLSKSTTYFVKVRALDTAGRGITVYSSAIQVKTTATTAPPAGLAVVAVGQETVDLTWKPAAGAARYRLAYSLNADMSGATWRDSDTANRTIYVSPNSLYYVKVRAFDATGVGISDYSAPVEAKTKAVPPAPPAALSAARTTSTTIDLTWGTVRDAAEYRVELTRSGGLPVYTRHPGTGADLRGLVPGAEYNARVRALDADGNALTSYSTSIKVRTTAVPVLAPVTNPLKVASYNVHCANCMDPVPGERPWEDRRDGVIADVIARMPDIIGFQEASQGWLQTETRSGGVSQFEDLRERLVAAGGKYAVTDADRNNCERSYTPTNCVYKDQGASQGTKIFYNPETVTVLRAGSQRLPDNDPNANARFVAWAEVFQKSSGKKFFFADTHLQTGAGADFTELRRQQALVVAATVARENTGKLPVIVVGDMNSSKWKTPTNAPYDVFVGSGLVDPLGNTYRSLYASGDATAEKVINRGANSFNAYDTTDVAGDPGTTGSYIDYIFTSKMRVQLYENVASIDSAGNRVGAIPSDHNMQFAILGLP